MSALSSMALEDAPRVAGLSLRSVLLGIAAACVVSVALALYTQHRLDMQPCPWCVLQRVLFMLIALLALAAAFMPRLPALLGVLAIDLLAACGIAAALFQHFVAAKSNSCAMTFADRLITGIGLDQLWPDVFEVRATCAEAAVKLFGVPFEFFSLGLFALIGAASALGIVALLRRG